MAAYYPKACLSVTEFNYENSALLCEAAVTIITLAISNKHSKRKA